MHHAQYCKMYKIKTAYPGPVPTRYVFVPCNVIGPSLHPKMRITFLDNLDIRGRFVRGFIFQISTDNTKSMTLYDTM